jgi:3-carboxy-cis,cis-muconate cycloisomerase
MAASCVFDSALFKNIFGTEEIREIFSDRSYVANLIQAECALARAEASVGVIPESAGTTQTDSTPFALFQNC